jgi:hypothetical protein
VIRENETGAHTLGRKAKSVAAGSRRFLYSVGLAGRSWPGATWVIDSAMEALVQLENQTDHIAMLALMLVGVLIRRLEEIGQLDMATERQLHKLVGAVRTHAENAGHSDLHVMFDNIDRALGKRERTGVSA